MSEVEFKFLDFKRLYFLRRVGSFSESPQEGRWFRKNEALGSSISEDQKMGRHDYRPGYEPTNMFFTRDSLFWGWRRVKEYYCDLLEFREDERKEKIIRIDRD